MDEGRAFRLGALLGPLLEDPAAGPANEVLAAGLRSLVLDGRLVVGAKVASERDLSLALGVSRSTVTAAYGRLRDEGYLLSSHGAGTRTAMPATGVVRPDEPGGGGDPLLDLTVAATAAPSALPGLVAAALDALPPLLGGPGLHPLGLPELRSAIAARLTAAGVRTSAEQVMVTQGALHGWNLLLRALTRPGDRVLVESPTYPAVLDAVHAHRLRAAAIGVAPEGWDLSATGPQRGSSAPVLAHVTPDHQNPTGHLATAAERRELLAALPPATLVVTDETFADLTLDDLPRRPRSLAAFAPADRVVTLGSLSKSVWAGLRIGWLRASPALVRSIATTRTSQDLGTPVLEQLVAVHVLAAMDELLRERRAVLRGRRGLLLGGLADQLPHWSPTRPAGGVATWVDLGDGCSSTRLAEAARSCGVRVTPGPRFTLQGTHDRFLRLPWTLPGEQLSQAVDLLALASRSARPGRGRLAERPLVWTA
jgi:DNA-binding transcriptional MocR family regulator